MILRVNEQINPGCNFLGRDALYDLDLEIQKKLDQGQEIVLD